MIETGGQMATETTGTASPQRALPGGVGLIHVCAAIVVAASAAAGRLPFLWFVDTLGHRPSWFGLFFVWVVCTGLYLLTWQQIGRGNRLVEVLMTVTMMLGGVWAIYSLVVSLLQVTGLGVDTGLALTLPWFLRLVAAVATLLAAAVYIRLGRGTESRDDDPLSEAAAPPAAVLVSVAGFVLCAYSLALLLPPQANQTAAVNAVLAATRDDVKTDGVVEFQSSLADAVDRESVVHPRDRWGMKRGFFSSGGKVVYDNTIQWGEMVVYRDQITCVARDIKSAEVVVRPGFCPG
ncbi:MAG: hypothetical protein ACXVXM_18630 [Nocardioidaceae bacterium]